MASIDRERKSQHIFYVLIVALLLGYGALKYRHVALAFEAYQGQVLDSDTRGAAK